MAGSWTIGRKITAGFAVSFALTLGIGGVAVWGLSSVVAAKDHALNVNAALLVDAERYQGAFDRKASSVRGFLLTKDPAFLAELRGERETMKGLASRLKLMAVTEEGRRLLETAERGEAAHQKAVEKMLEMKRPDGSLSEGALRYFGEEVTPLRDPVETSLKTFVAREEQLLARARDDASTVARRAVAGTAILAFLAALIAAAAATLLVRGLGRSIGTTVGEVQTSAAELKASANQQAAATREQASAMTEIATTLSELLATSRQIAEGAQHVSRIADQTAAAARSGSGIVEKSQESISAIRRQVDGIVSHMLELGKKSQQVRAIVDMVSELSEQTNILAINATIEAAGAGEAGRRFAVVGEEIRKLADRVGGSTKEIRALVDDVVSAVNTTVMATETGSKAVDAGTRQFGDVVGALRQIASQVMTTTEAAKEIELSTKQQSTAVEQVNVAIANVAQATRETEAASGETLQTASRLATLSTDLLRVVRSDPAQGS